MYELAGRDELDKKIVAGLERLSQVFRALLWSKAVAHQLSPLQIQILLSTCKHRSEWNTVTHLAREFQVSKPTVSDAVNILESKKLIQKISRSADNRRFSIEPTKSGIGIARDTENYLNPISSSVELLGAPEKMGLWQSIADIIQALSSSGIITVQRNCYNCGHYQKEANTHFCNLLQVRLKAVDIQLDCPEFQER